MVRMGAMGHVITFEQSAVVTGRPVDSSHRMWQLIVFTDSTAPSASNNSRATQIMDLVAVPAFTGLSPTR